VVKVGTQVLIDPDNREFATERLNQIACDIAALAAQGVTVLVVTSGAVGLGRQAIGNAVGQSLIAKQACATIGQPLLMARWSESLRSHGLTSAQLLVTALDFERRHSYLNLENTLKQLMMLGVIPIINENDATAVDELTGDSEASFGDNDRLSALIAARIGACALVILTSTDGVFTDNPDTNPKAQLIGHIRSLRELDQIVTRGCSKSGRGGMAAKLLAVRTACLCGTHVFIGSGSSAQPVIRLFTSDVGTVIEATGNVSKRKGWIGLAAGYRGVVTINHGARDALLFKGASLLPVGITEVRGDFGRSEVVQIHDGQIVIGRGVASYSAAELRQILGKRSDEISQIFGHETELDYPEEAIHRDNLLLFLGKDDDEL
jgi:glutamate 5-kinase